MNLSKKSIFLYFMWTKKRAITTKEEITIYSTASYISI